MGAAAARRNRGLLYPETGNSLRAGTNGAPRRPAGEWRVQSKAASSVTRVLLVDDHPIVREGLRAAIERVGGAKVVAEGGSGREAVALALAHAPDLVVMDIEMKDLDGISATIAIRAASPAVRILMLSGLSDSDSVLRALHAGANGYLLKDCALADIGVAVRAVSGGETYLSPQISAHVVAGMREATGASASEAPLLTARQLEILTLIAKGQSTKQIAFLLEVSAKTVETHRARIMERLGIHDVAGLVVYAIRTRLIDIGMRR